MQLFLFAIIFVAVKFWRNFEESSEIFLGIFMQILEKIQSDFWKKKKKENW